MTLLDDPPVQRSSIADHPTERAPLATWRFASRLARREVRRRPGRTVLVALLVAIPVMAMAASVVLYRTTGDDRAAGFERRSGAADLSLWVGLASPEADQVRDALPPGSRVVDVAVVWTGLEAAAGVAPVDTWVRFTDLPLDDPLTAGIVEIRSGRAPTAPDEMLLDERTAGRLGVGVGDTLELARPSGDWRVVGTGRSSDNHSEGLVVVHQFDRDRLVSDRGSRQLLIELPVGTTPDETAALAWDIMAATDTWIETPFESPFTTWDRETDDVRVLAWGWVAGALALAAVGIVIAAAFATSARRQLVTIGHLAANGSPSALIRRTLALQGSWTGVIGVVGGMALAGIGLVVLRPLVENLANRSIGSYRVVATDLLVIGLTALAAATIAAAVPARTASRIPVLSALSGRRPLASPSPRLVPIGLSLFLGGLGLLFVAAAGADASSASGDSADLFAFVAVLGGLGVVFGMCCATPLVIAGVGRLGSVASGTWRLAARSTARARTRSAGVVTAVATAGALAVAAVTIAAISIQDDVSSGSLPRDVVYLEPWTDWYDPGADGLIDIRQPEPFVVEPELRRRLEALLPGATFDVVRGAVYDPRPFDPERGPFTEDDWLEIRMEPKVATIADPAVIALAGLDASEIRLLDDVDLIEPGASGFSVAEFESAPGEAIVRDPLAAAPVVIAGNDGDIELTRAFRTSEGAPWPLYSLMSAERAEGRGLDVIDVGLLIRNPSDLTAAERRQVYRITGDSSVIESAFIEPGDDVEAAGGGMDAGPATGLSAHMAWDVSPLPVGLINAIIIAAAVLLTLLVVAIGLSLSATESRDERDVLLAVGAPPRTMSRVAGAKAFVMAGTGVVLAVPTGYLPTWVVYRTFSDDPVPVPWVTIGLLVVAVPLAAGLAAWFASSVARRVRPAHAPTPFAD